MTGFFDTPKLSRLIFHLLWSVFLLALGGIIGNRSDAYFMSSLPEIAKSITINSLLWIGLGVSLILCIGIAWNWLNDRDNLSKLATFDTTLDMLLPEIMATTSNLQNITQTFIERAFDITTQYILSSPRKAQLFLPDPNRQYLTSTSSYGWSSQNNRTSTTFCINYTNNSDKSTAAAAFNSKETILVHIKEKNGSSESDHPSYRFSASNSLPFKGSLICIPIIVGNASNDCLGVLCFDSYSVKEFEASKTKAALRLLARHIAVSLLIQQNISQRLPSQTVP